MIATATSKQFNQEPSKLLKAADQGITTEITSHGQSRAALIPQPGVTSGAELGKRLARMKPEPDTAAAVAAVIKGMDEAD